MSSSGLREKTRERRRATISRAALQLFAERGFDATTVADIAELAEVSTRTVSLYFPAKLDLALVYTVDASKRFAELIASNPSAPIAELCGRWVQEEFRNHDEMLALHRAMLAANPPLRGAQSREVTDGKAVLGRILAKEIGRRLDDPLVALVGGALDGVLASLLQLPPKEVQGSGAALSTVRLIRIAVNAAKHGELDQ